VRANRALRDQRISTAARVRLRTSCQCCNISVLQSAVHAHLHIGLLSRVHAVVNRPCHSDLPTHHGEPSPDHRSEIQEDRVRAEGIKAGTNCLIAAMSGRDMVWAEDVAD